MTRTCSHPGCANPGRYTTPRRLCRNHYRANKLRQTTYGLWNHQRFTDSTRARQHLQHLADAGMSQRLIADLTGLAQRTIWDVRTDARGAGRVSTVTERAILAVHPRVQWERLTPDAMVPNVGTSRRLQALSAIGWPGGKLCAELGWRNQQLTRIRLGQHPYVTARTAILVRDLYTRLWNVDGGNKRCRNLAANKQWALPLEWDDIDDPTETPTYARRTQVGQKDQALDRLEEVQAWLDDPRPEWVKGSVQQLAERLGCSPRTIERHKTRIRTQRETAA